MIEIDNLTKTFANLVVLKRIRLAVKTGETCVIIGPSGSGKSTLLRCLNLLEIPTEGTITLGGHTLQFTESTRLRKQDVQTFRRQTGMVFQGFNLFSNMTAFENVMEGQITVLKRPKSLAREKSRELLARVGLSERAGHYPHQLSGGQQQRVAIARAMAMDPKVLLFDEPTSALDPELVGDVLKVMQELAHEGMTMVVVTHEMNFAREAADHVIFMDDGRVVEVGTPTQVFEESESPRLLQFLNRINRK